MSQLTESPGHKIQIFLHMSRLTESLGHKIQIFFHMSRLFIESLSQKYKKVLWAENINKQYYAWNLCRYCS